MGTTSGVGHDLLKLLEFAAALHGPKAKEPPYVRSPFPLIALPVVLGEFVKESAEAIGVAPECVALYEHPVRMVEKHFRETHLPNLIKAVEGHTMSGPAGRQLRSPALQRLQPGLIADGIGVHGDAWWHLN